MLSSIIGIDPGSNTGVSVLGIDNNFNVRSLDTYCLHLPTDTYDIYKHFSRLDFLYETISSILYTHNPFTVGIELPFQHRFANAVILLSQYVSCIDKAVLDFNPHVICYRYPPKAVKKLIGATGNADKLSMFKAISNIPELNTLFSSRVRTEHEADATAIAYISLQDLKNYPHKLIMNRDEYNAFRR